MELYSRKKVSQKETFTRLQKQYLGGGFSTLLRLLMMKEIEHLPASPLNSFNAVLSLSFRCEFRIGCKAESGAGTD